MDTLLVDGGALLARPHGAFADRLLAMFKADRNHLPPPVAAPPGPRPGGAWIYCTC